MTYTKCQLTETPGITSFTGTTLTSNDVKINDLLLTCSTINIKTVCKGPFGNERCDQNDDVNSYLLKQEIH